MRLKIAALILCAAAASMTAQQAQQAPSAPPVVASVPSCPELATALTNLARSDVRMRDWPNLARYRDANKTLGAARSGEKRVVFMGDSITDAWPQRARRVLRRQALRRPRHQRPDDAADAPAVPAGRRST